MDQTSVPAALIVNVVFFIGLFVYAVMLGEWVPMCVAMCARVQCAHAQLCLLLLFASLIANVVFFIGLCVFGWVATSPVSPHSHAYMSVWLQTMHIFCVNTQVW